MQKLSITAIATACQARPNDVRSALKIMGKPVFGNVVFMKSADEIDMDFVLQIEEIRAMNQSQRERHASK